MIVAVPAPTPVNVPVLLTEATEILLETQGLTEAAVMDPDKFEVPLTHNVVVPETVGFAFTVTTVDTGHR